jgi:hypothetical protein
VTSGFWNLRFTPATIPLEYSSYLLAHSEWAISLVVGTARQGGLEDGVGPFSGTEFPLMGVACTLALTQDRAFHLWVLSKPLPAMVKTASLALGEIPSAPKRARPRKGPPKRAEATRELMHEQKSCCSNDSLFCLLQSANPGYTEG